MPTDKSTAKTQGYRRGINGKSSSKGVLEGTFDDSATSAARRQGYEQGQRDRMRIEKENEK